MCDTIFSINMCLAINYVSKCLLVNTNVFVSLPNKLEGPVHLFAAHFDAFLYFHDINTI